MLLTVIVIVLAHDVFVHVELVIQVFALLYILALLIYVTIIFAIVVSVLIIASTVISFEVWFIAFAAAWTWWTAWARTWAACCILIVSVVLMANASNAVIFILVVSIQVELIESVLILILPFSNHIFIWIRSWWVAVNIYSSFSDSIFSCCSIFSYSFFSYLSLFIL